MHPLQGVTYTFIRGFIMGSSSSEPEIDYDALRASYQGWLKDAEKTRDKQTTSEVARMSASGLKPGSSMWDQRMAKIEKDYQTQLGVIKGSETAKLIKKDDKKHAYQVSMDRQRAARDNVLRGEYDKYVKSVGPRDAAGFGSFKANYEGRDAMTLPSLANKNNRNWWDGGGPGADMMGPATAV